MYAHKILTRTHSTLTTQLELFSAQVLDQPSGDETLATWKRLESKLPLEYQTRILLAWNKHLAEVNEPQEIATTIDEIIQELRA